MTVTALGIDARRIRGRLAGCGLALERGMRVEVYGHLRVWAGTGSAELRAIDIDTRVGVGRAEQDRRRAITVIRRAGLSERQARMGTPLAPLRVAVISPAGQGLEDFRARLDMTAWAWDVRVLVTPSEGADAGERLARAVRAAGSSPDVDVVVVTRGGGSASLDAYDDRAVIMAVADCPKPVMVAVGHHSDRPLAEMVAWRAEATPTAAAVALDRILAAQLSEVAAEAAGLVDDATCCLSGLAEELEREWGEARLALQRAARPTEPAWPASPASRIEPTPSADAADSRGGGGGRGGGLGGGPVVGRCVVTSPGKRVVAAIDGLRQSRRRVTTGPVAVSDLARVAGEGVELYVAARAELERSRPPERQAVPLQPDGPCPVAVALTRIGQVRAGVAAGQVTPAQVEAVGQEITGLYLTARGRIEATAVQLRQAKGRIG